MSCDLSLLKGNTWHDIEIPSAQPTEKYWQHQFIKYAEDTHKAMALKIQRANKNGMPDLLLLTHKGVFMLECKRLGKKLTRHQKEVQALLRQYPIHITSSDSLANATKQLIEWLAK